jgi:hypothetical protein
MEIIEDNEIDVNTLCLNLALFKPYSTCMIQSSTDEDAKKVIKTISKTIDMLKELMDDAFYMSFPLNNTKHELTFKNGSKIISTIIDENRARGRTIDILVINDSVDNISESYMTAILPALSAVGGKFIVTD